MKEATVFFTQIVQGSIKKLNFCAACSQKKGLQDPMEFLLSDLFQGLGLVKEHPVTAAPILVCSACGFSQEDFKKRGRLGCSSCYNVFLEALTPMLQNAHRNLTHKGKIPEKFAETFLRTEELEELRSSLQKAIKSECYEEAALYRDRIIALEKTVLKEQQRQEIALENKSLLLEEKKTPLSAGKKRESSSKLTELPPEKS
ncbi:MAG: UvrB/UvrC motif-containing protein [Chthoniobacterales bacterium]|nr:UvrB/UvrC motif-containing protein [Chthoniobacterales bacterium]